jgi:hypothetical protein
VVHWMRQMRIPTQPDTHISARDEITLTDWGT